MKWKDLIATYVPQDEALDEPPLPAAEQAALLERTLQKAGLPGREAGRKRKLFFPRRLAGVCAAAALLLFVFGASAAFLMDGRLLALWSGGDPSTVAAVQLGQSSENGGYTATLVEAAGDDNLAYFLIELQGPDGEALAQDLGFARVTVRMEDSVRMGWSCEQLPDDDLSDNRTSFLLAFDSSEKMSGRKLSITLEDLYRYRDEGEVLAAGGSWEFETAVQLSGVKKTFRPGGSLEQADGTLHLSKVTVTPVSVSVALWRNPLPLLFAKDAPDYVFPEMCVELADGTLLTEEDRLSGGAGGEDASVTLRASYRRILDPDEVTAVILDGVRFELK